MTDTDRQAQEWQPCSCGWPESECAEGADHVTECGRYRRSVGGGTQPEGGEADAETIQWTLDRTLIGQTRRINYAAATHALARLRVRVQEADRREDAIHTALAEANVERSAGVDEPLWSDAQRVRILYAERDALKARMQEADRREQALTALLLEAEAERDLLREEVRIREESQIPVIPRAAAEKMAALEARLLVAEQALRELVAIVPRETPDGHEILEVRAARAALGDM